MSLWEIMCTVPFKSKLTVRCESRFLTRFSRFLRKSRIENKLSRITSRIESLACFKHVLQIINLGFSSSVDQPLLIILSTLLPDARFCVYLACKCAILQAGYVSVNLVIPIACTASPDRANTSSWGGF